MTRAILMLLAGSLLHGQTADPSLKFEVASVKPNPLPAGGGGMHGCNGGPGTSDPSLYRCQQATISLMAFQAYGLKLYQITPAYYADKEEFNITAKVPPGATAEQVKVMLQNLLTERFKLAFHYEKKEMAAYELVVAKGQPKMKEWTPPAAVAQDGTVKKLVSRTDGRIHLDGNGMTMDTLVMRLSQRMDKPVLDATDLKGKYDFTLEFANPTLGNASVTAPAPDGEAAPTVFEAVEKQLGLKLEPKKRMIDIFVLDHAEKTPVEN